MTSLLYFSIFIAICSLMSVFFMWYVELGDKSVDLVENYEEVCKNGICCPTANGIIKCPHIEDPLIQESICEATRLQCQLRQDQKADDMVLKK